MPQFFEMIQIGIEAAAMVLLLAGLVIATVIFLTGFSRESSRPGAFNEYRNNLGRTLLLTLEVLIAADIVKTVAVEQTFQSLGQLALLVLIRTFLSFALELELTGRWPWQSKPDQQDKPSVANIDQEFAGLPEIRSIDPSLPATSNPNP